MKQLGTAVAIMGAGQMKIEISKILGYYKIVKNK